MPIVYGDLEGEPPDPVSFRTVHFRAGTVFPPRRQTWGELNYAIQGVAEISVEGVTYLSPPQYALWIPPGFEHDAITRQDIRYVSIYVGPDFCSELPQQPCTLDVSSVLKAVVADFELRGVHHPRTPQDMRLAMVIIDQIGAAPRFDRYLPTTDDPILAPVLARLQHNPGDTRSLSEWAHSVGVTERTLARRCQQQLGLSFNHWRLRLRLLTALALIEEGEAIHRIARRLGYSTPSAFIAMFQRLTGQNPTAMRSRYTKSR